MRCKGIYYLCKIVIFFAFFVIIIILAHYSLVELWRWSRRWFRAPGERRGKASPISSAVVLWIARLYYPSLVLPAKAVAFAHQVLQICSIPPPPLRLTQSQGDKVDDVITLY